MSKKRILFPVSNKSTTSYYFIEGLAYAYSLSHEVLVIGIEQKSLFDLFAEWKPDLVFVHENDYDDVFVRCVNKYNTNTVILTNTKENRVKVDGCSINMDAFGATANTLKYNRNKLIQKTVDVSYISEYDPNANNDIVYQLANENIVFQIFSNNPWPLTQWMGTANGNESYIYNRSKIVITDNVLDVENVNACGTHWSETNINDIDNIKILLTDCDANPEPVAHHSYMDVVSNINKALLKKYSIEL